MDIPLSPEQLDAIRRETLAGNKIQAIKLYREATGKGLAESKHDIETFEVEWRSGAFASGPAPARPATPTPQQLEQVRREVLAGNKIQAIKLYREISHVSLFDAKQAIDQLDLQLRASTPESFAVPPSAESAVPSPPTPEQLEPIKAQALAGNKIQAIKLYRELTGLGLAESKQAVEDLTDQWRAAAPPATPAPPQAPPKAATKKPDKPFARPAKTGCNSLILFGGGAVWAIAHWLLSR